MFLKHAGLWIPSQAGPRHSLLSAHRASQAAMCVGRGESVKFIELLTLLAT